MKKVILACAVTLLPVTVMAQNEVAAGIVRDHILPRFERLAERSETLADAARQDCTARSVPLRDAYNDAFDAWVTASHLRFGPTEVDDRAFALAFWPDSRGATPKVLNKLIADQDPVATSATDFSDVSIAARGFYAMEFLLYDETLAATGDAGYRCSLIQTITADTAVVTSAISQEWTRDYASAVLNPSADGVYRSEDEVLQEFFKALSSGLQFTSETRLGRPLGTFDKPRPTRSEAWRSGRSARHVSLSLRALQELATALAHGDLNVSFDRVRQQVEDLNDPIFAGVAAPQGRLKVEVVQQSVEMIREMVLRRLGPKLGVAAGFNALDGD
jgi:predicted lipoprotein